MNCRRCNKELKWSFRRDNDAGISYNFYICNCGISLREGIYLNGSSFERYWVLQINNYSVYWSEEQYECGVSTGKATIILDYDKTPFTITKQKLENILVLM